MFIKELAMKNNNYITITGWMVNELSLSGNDLICYAIIYGFSQDDNYWEGSQSYLSEWLGVSKRATVEILKRLVSDGHIVKQEYEVNKVKFCKYKAVTPNLMDSKESSPNNNSSVSKEEGDKSLSKKAEIANFVERMYKLYPSRCPERNTYLGKSMKDKDRIKNLLKRYTMEQIEKVIRYEVDTKYGKCRMYNFSTFLNNFPDPNALDEEYVPNKKEADAKQQLVINGVVYR